MSWMKAETQKTTLQKEFQNKGETVGQEYFYWEMGDHTKQSSQSRQH